jgi:hypothetical protein
MKIINSIALLSIGAVFGVGMVLSCSNDSPHRSDAAACDCPASEPPIAGRLIFVEGLPQTLQAGEQDVATAACMPGTQFVSGTCTAGNPNVLEDIQVQQFGFNQATSVWFCAFKNNELTAAQVKATAVCLKPPA